MIHPLNQGKFMNLVLVGLLSFDGNEAKVFLVMSTRCIIHHSVMSCDMIAGHKTGAFFKLNNDFTPEAVRDRWSEVVDFSEATNPVSTQGI
jgi:hypothetical protein